MLVAFRRGGCRGFGGMGWGFKGGGLERRKGRLGGIWGLIEREREREVVWLLLLPFLRVENGR